MNPYEQQPQQPFNAYDQYNEPYKDYQEPRFPHGGNTEIRVESVLFVPTGTYNTQFRRPWVTNYTVENATAVHDAVASAYRQHNIAKAQGQIHAESKYTVDPMTLAGVSGSFIQPSAVAEAQAYANLAGGWGEQAGRFMMSLWIKKHEAVTPTRYVLIGYTNYLGFTQMNVDPAMELTINTIFEVRDVQVNDQYGPRIESQMIQVNQVLLDPHFTGPDQAATIRMRPFEVATSLARLHDPLLSAQGVTTVDTRDIQSGTPTLSNQHHTNPNDYMANVISGLVNGFDLSRQTGRTGAKEPYHAAARELRDPSAQKDPFIMAISRAVGNGNITSTFRWRDLLRIDPGAERDGVCFIQWRDRMQFLGSIGENMHTAGETSNWNGQDYPTQVAVQIANMIPSMMVDLGLRRIDIYAANVNAGQPFCAATNGIGVVQGVNLAPQQQALSTLFFQQCVLPMTFNGGILYDISVQADLFGEIVIKLRLDANPAYTYVQPAYCSSAMTPVLTTRRDTLDNLSQAFNNLQKEALPANPVMPLIHDLGLGTTGSASGKRY